MSSTEIRAQAGIPLLELTAELVDFTVQNLVLFLEFTNTDNGRGQRGHLFRGEGKRDLQLSHGGLELYNWNDGMSMGEAPRLWAGLACSM